MKILNISLATTFALITTLFGNHLAYADKSPGYEKAKKRCNDPQKYPNVPNVKNSSTYYACVDSPLGGYDPVLMNCAEPYLVFLFGSR